MKNGNWYITETMNFGINDIKKLRIMESLDKFNEVTNSQKMTYDEYKAIQAEVVKNLQTLDADHQAQLRLALEERNERLAKLQEVYFRAKSDFNNAVHDVELVFNSAIKSLNSLHKSKCVEQYNIRDMANVIFTRQFRKYPEITDTPAFVDDLADIEPNVELDTQEGGEDGESE